MKSISEGNLKKVVKYFFSVVMGLICILEVGGYRKQEKGKRGSSLSILKESASPTVPGTWSQVGHFFFFKKDFGDPSLYVDAGTPYLTGMDFTDPQYLRVVKYNGKKWVYVGKPDVINNALYPKICVDQGTPYIAYTRYTKNRKDEPEYYPYFYSANVIKYNGVKWVEVGKPDLADGTVYEINIFIYKHVPYVFYIGWHYGNSVVMRYKSHHWAYVGKPSFYPDDGLESTAIYVWDKTPYVAFMYSGLSSNTNDINYVMKYNGKEWVYVGRGEITPSPLDGPKIFISKGIPYIAFLNVEYKVTVMKYKGSHWTKVGKREIVHETTRALSFFVRDGVPYVAYSTKKSHQIRVKVFQNHVWKTLGDESVLLRGDGDKPDLFVYKNSPYIAYYAQGKGMIVMRFQEIQK
jgi:hypothetical protein